MKYQHWLAQTLPNTRILRLKEEGIRAEEIYYMKDKALEKLPGLTEAELERIKSHQRLVDADSEWEKLQEMGISVTGLEEKDYPQKLKNIGNPPSVLYFRGRLPKAEGLSAAIVGARGRSAYGSSVAFRLAEELAKCGCQIISGLALGIDTDGHTGCLNAGGKTFAVLGCGVDVVYPRQNEYLYHKIIDGGGGILSEFVPGTAALARQFPQRNRIISGLSDKVIVIEARKKSGSLITADFAMEQGRDVYALPGRITDELSQGTNMLIRQGAGAIVSIEDFLEEMKLETGTICTQLDFRKNLLEKDEAMVYSLVDFQPVGLGVLMNRGSMQLSELLDILERLKEKGCIRECVPNYFVRCL